MKTYFISIGLVIYFSASSYSSPLLMTNEAFETGALYPWYQDRELGEGRDWRIGSLDPHTGSYYAFGSGRFELRQDFEPIQSLQILSFSFFSVASFSTSSDLWVELFYSDDTTSGYLEFLLDPQKATQNSISGWQWEEIILTPFIDNTKYLSGVSVFGIPENILSIDSFSLAVIPESKYTTLALIALIALWLSLFRRKPLYR